MFSEEMNALWWVLKKQIKIESVYLLLRHPVYYTKKIEKKFFFLFRTTHFFKQ